MAIAGAVAEGRLPKKLLRSRMLDEKDFFRISSWCNNDGVRVAAEAKLANARF